MPINETLSKRFLVTMTRTEAKAIATEAKARGLHLATYLRSLIISHPDRRSRNGAVAR